MANGSREWAERIAASAVAGGLTVAAAESVTAGNIAVALAAAPDASIWFRGSVVAYQAELKQSLLGVTSDRVITADCARQMAEGALRVTGASVAVAVTGVGGPDPEESRPPGTVYICAGRPGGLEVSEHHFDGTPAEVVERATAEALRRLGDAISS